MLTLQPPFVDSCTATNAVDATAHMHRTHKGAAVRIEASEDLSGIGIITYTFKVWLPSDARNHDE